MEPRGICRPRFRRAMDSRWDRGPHVHHHAELTAAGATTLVALNAGSLTFQQGCAMIVGQSIGTAATTGLVMIGGSLAVRRSSMAHIVFSLSSAFSGSCFWDHSPLPQTGSALDFTIRMACWRWRR